MTATGKLDRLLKVYEDTSVIGDQEADGYQEPSWSEKAKMWCKVEIRFGQEMIQDAAQQWQQPQLITMRYDSRVVGMTTAPTQWTIRNGDGTVVWDIISAMDVGLQHVWLELTCVVGTPVPLT